MKRINKDYWNYFFSNDAQPVYPSEVVVRFLKTNFRASDHEAKLLDMGCGNGRNGLAAIDMGFDVWLVDYSEKGLKNLHSQKVDANRIIIADIGADELDLPNQFFDCVISISVLYHLAPNQMKVVLNRIRDLLKPGGYILCNFLPKNHWLNNNKSDDYYLRSESWITHSNEIRKESKIICVFYDEAELRQMFSHFGKVKIIREEVPSSMSLEDDKEQRYPVLWVMAQL